MPFAVLSGFVTGHERSFRDECHVLQQLIRCAYLHGNVTRPSETEIQTYS
jgi:hypothetical protein